MRVLLFETSAHYPSSPLFLEALQELATERPGHFEYEFVDQAEFEYPAVTIATRILRRLLRRSSVDEAGLNRTLFDRTKSFRPDLVLICKGAYIWPETVAAIRQHSGAFVINYATDDPFNPIVSTRHLIEAIPTYDLYACTKRAIMEDVAQAGGRNVVYVPFGYKPSVHFPEPPATSLERQRFESDVVFVGGCDSDRAYAMKALVKSMPNLDLALYGGFWNRQSVLRHYWRGFASGRGFRMVLAGAKIALNLVRHANRDGHVMRTFEIPACGAFMLAERTEEHQQFFRENSECAYFEGWGEMIHQIRYYLSHPDRRRILADACRNAVVSGRHTYGNRLSEIINMTNMTGGTKFAF